MRMQRLLPFAAGAAFALAAPNAATAYEALAEIVRHLPEMPDGEVGEFYFMSPAALADWSPRDWTGVGYQEFDDALLDAEVGIATVGIDFTALDGIAHWGTPPLHLFYIVGAAVIEDDVRAALLARGLEETEHDDVTVFAIGEDNGVDLSASELGYPFGGGWRAHRVAVDDGVALLAFSWTGIDLGLEAAQLNGDLPVQALLADMVDAAKQASPAGYVAYGAAVLPTDAFALPDDPPEDAAPLLPRFEAAMYLAARRGDVEMIQIALAYADPADATAAADGLTGQLDAVRSELGIDGKVLQENVPREDGGMIAIVALAFPPNAADHPSSRFYSRLLSDVFSRRYEFIAISAND